MTFTNETEYWKKIEAFYAKNLSDGDKPEIDFILLVIGIQELGMGYRKYSKDEKINILHIAVCKLLEPYHYYTFSHFDEDNWPHYTLNEELPPLQSNEQSILIKKAIIQYFIDNKILEEEDEL